MFINSFCEPGYFICFFKIIDFILSKSKKIKAKIEIILTYTNGIANSDKTNILKHHSFFIRNSLINDTIFPENLYNFILDGATKE